MWVKLMHVHTVIVKGREYHYHRITREKLPANKHERVERVVEINSQLDRPNRSAGVGSFTDLIARYKASPEFGQLRPFSKRDYRRHLDAIGETWGNLPVKRVMRKNVRKMRDALGDTPRKANYRMQVLSLLINFGIDVDEQVFGNTNPVRMRKLRLREGPGYAPWPDNVISDFAKAAYPELRRVVIGGVLESDPISLDTELA